MDTELGRLEATAFRPAKRRKYTRNRRASDGDELGSRLVDTAAPDNDPEGVIAPVTNILRLRKHKIRKHGIEFSNTRTLVSEPSPSSTDLAIIDADAERIKAISDRFVAHSGQVVDVDTHMFVFPLAVETTSREVTELTSQGLPI